MAKLVLCFLLCSVATVLGGIASSYSEIDAGDYQGYNNIEDYGHYSQFVPPAYSTVSLLMSTGHDKPVSYSGFTNHGRGHHDPGFSYQHRSDGFYKGYHS